MVDVPWWKGRRHTTRAYDHRREPIVTIVLAFALSRSRSYSRSYSRHVLQLRAANCVMQLLLAIFRVNVFVPYVYLILRCESVKPSFRASNKIDRQYQRVNKTRWIVSSRHWHILLTWDGSTDERSIWTSLFTNYRFVSADITWDTSNPPLIFGWLLCVPTCIYAPSFGKVVRAAPFLPYSFVRQNAGIDWWHLLKLCGFSFEHILARTFVLFIDRRCYNVL